MHASLPTGRVVAPGQSGTDVASFSSAKVARVVLGGSRAASTSNLSVRGEFVGGGATVSIWMPKRSNPAGGASVTASWLMLSAPWLELERVVATGICGVGPPPGSVVIEAPPGGAVVDALAGPTSV
jgi:hypothetical protein